MPNSLILFDTEYMAIPKTPVGDDFSISLDNENHKFGWLQGLRKGFKEKELWCGGST
jgi:hypothetical protein